MRKDEWHGLPYFDVFGRKAHFTIREIQHFVTHRYFVLFVILVVLLLVLLDPHDSRLVMPLFATIILWSIGVFSWAGIYISLLVAGVYVSRRYSRFAVFLPLIGMVAATVTTFVMSYNISLFSGREVYLKGAIPDIPFNIVLSFVFETIFFVFVMNAISTERRREIAPPALTSKKPPVPAVSHISVAGKKFEASKIYAVCSQDHYIEVVTTTSKVLLRGRLTDVTSQLSAHDGIMPHRSYWVSRSAVSIDDNKSIVKSLKLVNGMVVPVARGRVAKVRKWLGV